MTAYLPTRLTRSTSTNDSLTPSPSDNPMSYYFAILSPLDSPVFELTFGTSKQGGDGIARFKNTDTSRYMNQFIVHASLDVVEEVQWLNSSMYLKSVDSYPPTSATISCFITGTSHKFLLLHQPSAAPSASTNNPSANRSSTTSVPHNPTSPQTEEAIRQFMTEVFECWVKTSMSPFYRTGMEIKSPVFRQRVVGAGRKWL